MEMIVGPKEGNCEENARILKSSIGQSSVDLLSNAKKKEDVKCGHFSIRGYVAETRKKNWEFGWPFPPPGENEGLEGQLSNMLPPLDVPKFRYWGCQKCVQTSNASANAEDVPSLVLEMICCGRRDATDGSEGCPIVHCDEREIEAGTKPDTGQDIVSFQKRNFHPYESSDDEDEDAHNLHDQESVDQLADSNQPTKFKRPHKIRLLNDILREKNSVLCPELSNSKQVTNVGDVSTELNQTKAPYQPDRLALCDHAHVGNDIEKKSKKRKAFDDEDHNLLPKRCSKSLGKSRFYQKDQAENGFCYSDGLYSNGESHFPENGKHKNVSQNHIDDMETLSEDRHQQHSIESWQGFSNGRANHTIMDKGKEIEHVEVPTIHWGLKNKRGSLEKLSTSAMRSKDVPFLSNSKIKKNLNRTKAAKNQSNDRAKKMGESEALDDISLEIVELLAKSRHECRSQEAQSTDQVMLNISEKTVNVKDSENVSRVSGKNLKKIFETCKRNSLDMKQMVQSLDKKGLLASSSFHTPMDLQGPNYVSREIQKGNYIGERREILSEEACACTQKPIGNSTNTSTYMPATELLELMDAGMCPILPCRENPDLSREKLTNRLNKDHINLGMYCHPSPIMYPVDFPIQRQENSTLRIEESEKMVVKTDKLSRKGKAKVSHSRKHDQISTKSVPSKLGVGDKVAIEFTNWKFGIEMCSVNRNPADFTIPASRNRFMIGFRQLQMEKTISKRGRPGKGITEAPHSNENAHN